LKSLRKLLDSLMGIQVEFNPDLALRHMDHYRRGERSLEECIPEDLEPGREYDFLKSGQRMYYFLEPVPLLQTEGGGQLSRPLASVTLLEVTHFLQDGEVWTRGRYKVKRVFDVDDPTIHFEGMQPLD
jgi:hypothetical protein